MIGIGMSISMGTLPPAWTPRALFTGAAVGAWFDPSDISTLFQGGSARSHVTAPGQTVGTVLDRAANLARGPELAVNGNFSNGLSGWTNVGGWYSVVDGRAYHPLSANFRELRQDFTGLTGAYEVRFAAEVLSGSVAFGWHDNPVTSAQVVSFGVGAHVFCGIAARGLTLGQFSRASATEFYIDNVSVRAVPGFHANNRTSAQQPLYQASGGLAWLASDLVDDVLPATLPNLGTSATVWFATATGTTILTGQTVSGAFNLLRGAQTYAVGAINRALSGPETTALTAYLNRKRGAP